MPYTNNEEQGVFDMHEDIKRAIDRKIDSHFTDVEDKYWAVNRFLANYISDTLLPVYRRHAAVTDGIPDAKYVVDIINALNNGEEIIETQCMPLAVNRLLILESLIVSNQVGDRSGRPSTYDMDNMRRGVAKYTMLVIEAYHHTNQRALPETKGY